MIAYWVIQAVSGLILAAVVGLAVRRYKVETDALTARLLAAGGRPPGDQVTLAPAARSRPAAEPVAAGSRG